MAVDLSIVESLVRDPWVGHPDQISVEDLPGDWRVWFEERAAVKEYDGNLPRERAEAEALTEVCRAIKKSKKMLALHASIGYAAEHEGGAGPDQGCDTDCGEKPLQDCQGNRHLGKPALKADEWRGGAERRGPGAAGGFPRPGDHDPSETTAER